MSTITPAFIRNCPNCDAELPLGSLACPQCHALVHGVRLDQLAKDARALEVRGLFPQARELWEYSLPLLPQDSRQAEWVRERLRALQAAETAALEAQSSPEGSQAAPGAKKPKAPQPAWVKKLGPFGPVALLLLKLKSALFLIFKLKFLLSFGVFIFLYVGLFGWRFGLGFCACILIHELGHFIDIKRRGLPAEMPVFLPGFGAYVRWTALGVTRSQIAQISLAGPLAGWIAGAICFLLYTYTGQPVWAALARSAAYLNTLNLIPIWLLDGGKAVIALGIVERAGLLVAAIALWAYTGEGLFLFVAAGVVWCLISAWRSPQSVPRFGDIGSFAYYVAVLIALGVLLHVTDNPVADAALR